MILSFDDKMKINYIKIIPILYTTIFLVGLLAGWEYSARQRIKNSPKPSEILPNQVNLDSKVDPCLSPKELIFKGCDPSNKCDVSFIDEGYNGSLDMIIITTAAGQDTVSSNSPYFPDWNKKFLEMRKRRFGG